MPANLQADVDVNRIAQLIQWLPADQYSACLSYLVHQLVPSALVGDATAAGMEPEEAVSCYILERLGRTRSDAYAAALISMVRNNDTEFDAWLFSDDREQMILVADAQLAATGEELLERYLDYRDNYPEYGVIHPSDYSGPNEKDGEEEWARLVSDFTDLVRDWRDGFLRELVEDVNRVSST
jgi:hypothetical protein